VAVGGGAGLGGSAAQGRGPALTINVHLRSWVLPSTVANLSSIERKVAASRSVSRSERVAGWAARAASPAKAGQRVDAPALRPGAPCVNMPFPPTLSFSSRSPLIHLGCSTMPPMHSTPRPPQARTHLAADQTLNLSFPPKTPGGTRHGGMDDWLDGIDLSAEIELEEEVLTGFGERRGNLFAVDDIRGLEDWRPSATAEELAVVEPVEPPALQLPTPSPEPGALPLPPAQAPRTASTASRATRNAVASSSTASLRLRSSRAASDALRTREQLPPPPARADQQPVASGSRPRATGSLRLPASPNSRASRLRSPVDDQSRRAAGADGAVAARPKAGLPRPTARRSRTRSPEVQATASRPRPSVARPVTVGSTRLPRPSESAALAVARPVSASVAANAQPTPAEPQPPRRPISANDSFKSFVASDYSRSFSFSRAVDEPPKDDFFARRLRDSYIGPVGITGLAASSSPPVAERDEGESIEQEISRLREEIRVSVRLRFAPLLLS